ncbi:RWD domain-containing protein 4-like [Ruditapes philippinarum]|uniref:RWD domain-containing protein 4-like n=1 Tax=Ruditapes philippinarum TaxID=129788 RepID=UPI00295A7A1B|nr:RWD domain-containing protein 4-like [Ruditapes philippinarum]XP_060566611.1 RWD domain-containing protein 4-like [Ruditapes philippinarum]
MTNKEQQDEELEVLQSIYDGDENFKKTGDSTFQYKYGEHNSYKSLVVEITWGESYPESPPTINMDTFYNKHVVPSVKEKILQGLLEQVEDLLETAMTYTLFEWVKENYDDLMADQPDAPIVNTKSETDLSQTDMNDENLKKKERKEQLTKHQKRRLYEKMGNATGEKPRGWNWVDIVKHLSQTGSQDS